MEVDLRVRWWGTLLCGPRWSGAYTYSPQALQVKCAVCA